MGDKLGIKSIKDKAHKAAEAIRNTKRAEDEVGTGDGNTVKRSKSSSSTRRTTSPTKTNTNTNRERNSRSRERSKAPTFSYLIGGLITITVVPSVAKTAMYSPIVSTVDKIKNNEYLGNGMGGGTEADIERVGMIIQERMLIGRLDPGIGGLDKKSLDHLQPQYLDGETKGMGDSGQYVWIGIPEKQSLGDYLLTSGEQILLGNYTDEVTLLGTGGQIATGLLGIDLPGDIRDISADFVNWEWSWGHVGQTAIDIAGVLPVIGAIKYGDEAGAIIKGVKKTENALDGLSGAKKCIALELFDELGSAGVKYTKEATVGVVKNPKGTINWLEIGNEKAGLKHIMDRHSKEFASWGLTNNAQVGELILKTISDGGGKAIGDGVEIFDVTIDGATKQLKVVTGSNGFIVTAHPYSK